MPTPQPTMTQKIAWSWVALAGAFYVYDLLRQFFWDGFADATGRAFGEDFINYWSGAFLAWHGRAAAVYDVAAYHAFQETIVGPAVGFYHYSYPPVLLVLTAPLALIPYVPALGVWLVSSWLCFYRALRLAMLERHALVLALATPAVFINALGGQNGAWTAAFLGGGLCLLERHPVIAGILFGLQSFKPQLGILIPVALIAGRQWRALLAASATVTTLVLLSVVLFGVAMWHDHIRVLSVLRQFVLEDAVSNWHRMVSVFMFARRLGADVPAAYVVQAAAAIIVAAIVTVAWFRDAPPPIRNAALISGTFLATPYLQDYDLVVGAFVVAWLTSPNNIPKEFERPALVASALILLVAVLNGVLAKVTGLALGPLFVLPAFLLAAKLSLTGLTRHRPAASPVVRSS